MKIRILNIIFKLILLIYFFIILRKILHYKSKINSYKFQKKIKSKFYFNQNKNSKFF
jgi:hypothetical protein